MTLARPAKTRLAWVDNARGFIILNTSLSAFMPEALRERFSFFMLHSGPSEGRVTYYDLGLGGFLLLIGICLPLSIQQRERRAGKLRAYVHVSFRYILFVVIGVALQIFHFRRPTPLTTPLGSSLWIGPIPMLPWHSLAALGTCGLVTLALLALPPFARIMSGAALFALYYCMVFDGPWLEYVSYGQEWLLLPSVMVFPLIMIYGTVIGESTLKIGRGVDWWYIVKLCALGVVTGSVSWMFVHRFYIPLDSDMMSPSFIALVLSVTSFYVALFLTLQFLWGKPIPLIASFGKNSFICFLIYLQAKWMWRFTDLSPTYPIFVVGFLGICALVLYLDRRNLSLQV